ncbi:MAG: hypothetical protein JXM70_03270, partial [Pirellulales bacterium]|nr:hypothetical protein [Pirellulales bacterium]
MNPKRHKNEDLNFARLFDAAMNNVPPQQNQAEEIKPADIPPDTEFLARLREISTEVFVQQTQPTPKPPKRRKKMIVLAMRALTTSAAVVAVAFGIMWSSKPSLTDDGRIGKVTDRQGIVSVRPLNTDRWSPVVDRLVLQPGDWLRTDARGANAVKIHLLPQIAITLGPGSMVELMAPGKVRLISGEMKVVAEQKSPLELLGPDDQKHSIDDTRLFRVDGKKIVPIKKSPRWLDGFEGTTNNESIGSLIAKVDGRNVPLTVGYHKVTVDIRDQIARTTIEESFVNHTNRQLEGVFHFPLPQDASISGFAMWIGDELVEADVVEKQRAREIYETILRERRDPGLLEWTGGNIFKARVFPIFAHSEKRIKITYTQVLPRRGNRYRYSYALQSELLKQNPLRELAIDVKINSAVSLSKVTSPTHPARINRTDHSARVEFSAQEYTPTSDFEVVVETDGRQSDVVMIPHRRGDDGYFMLQLTPPSDSGQWQRDVLPDGDPINLLILADTSASMDEDSRRQQAELVASLLGSLTAKDTFNLATCDVGTHWTFDKPVKPDGKKIDAARDFLDRRVSLGWTDLDKAFKSALEKSGPNTHIVYVGDGIITAKDTDPVRFANRLRRHYEGKTATCHAVATSSSFEPLVLKTIASLGGGSLRFISGQNGPQAVALELLGEITQPGIRDIKVEFKGLRTARVYPGRLPNLPAGSQQILLGRYLPEGADQKGQVIVTGRRGDEKIRMKTDVAFADAESGNSFIPRLWARMHLDELLDQGATPSIKDEIIALSEEYHIMTPYTSLLVLESDADRERFKVKRRFQMRDGQKFFAKGRDNADYELVQQQMRRAGGWRLGLRAAVLRDLAGLGRSNEIFEQERHRGRYGGVTNGIFLGRMSGPMTQTALPTGGGKDMDANWYFQTQEKFKARTPLALDYEYAGIQKGFVDGISDDKSNREWGDFDVDGIEVAGKPAGVKKFPEGRGKILADELRSVEELPMLEAELKEDISSSLFDDRLGTFDSPEELGQRLSRVAQSAEPLPSDSYFESGKRINMAGWPRKPERSQPALWFGTLFPYLPPMPSGKKIEEPKSTWPAEARQLAQSLLRTEQLAKIDGGARIHLKNEYFDTLHKTKTSQSQTHALVSPDAWLVRTGGGNAQTLVNWCNKTERGVLSKAFLLGRVRKSSPKELKSPPLGLEGHVLNSLEYNYRNHIIAIQSQGDGRKLLTLKHANNPDYEIRISIDTRRHVITKIESLQYGKTTSTATFGDFVRWAGAWWAGTIERTDAEGRRVSRTTQTFKSLSKDEFAKKAKAELAACGKTQFIKEPLVSVKDAKQNIADKKATFDDQLAMLLHFSATQQWERTLKHLEAAEGLANDKPGMRYIRTAVLNTARRREEVKKRYLEDARALAKAPGKQSESLFLADYIRGQADQILENNERLELLDAFKPVYERQPPLLLAMKRWAARRVDYLQQTNRVEEEMKLLKQLASEYPTDANLQQQYAQRLIQIGEHEAAWAWFNASLAKDRKWHEHERESLRNAQAQFLREQGRYDDLAKYLEVWIEENPKTQYAYPQYLTALIRTDREKEAWRLMAKWFEDARKPQAQEHGRLTPATQARLDAAVSQALGQGYNLYTNRLDDRWHKPLERTALFFAAHKHNMDIANRIMGNHYFRQTDACRRVRAKAVEMLLDKFDKLSDAQVQLMVDWIMPNDPAVEIDTWKKIAASAKKRYDAMTDPDARHRFGETVLKILPRVSDADSLDFMRLRYRQGPEKYRAEYARRLFNTLLSRPFSEKHEDEAFSLLDKMVDSEDPGVRLSSQISGLQRLTDHMVKARCAVRIKAFKHPEKLTRTELRDKNIEALRLARQDYADRLKQRTQKLSRPLSDWFTIERLYVETQLERDPQRIAEECWELLGAKPLKRPETTDRMQFLHGMLQHRVITTLSNLAVQKKAKPELIERLMKYFDEGIATDADNPYWKQCKYRMLIALDRPEQLEAVLRSWIEPGEADNHLRRSLAFVLAEQGKLSEAITLLETVEKSDELSPSDYRTLSGWYMAEGHREQYLCAIVNSYKTTDEWQLRRWLENRLRLWQRSDSTVPTEMHKDVPLVFKAIFEKSDNPANHLHHLQEFYRSTHDFRLLAGLAESVIGHTAGKVYPILQNSGGILSEVRDEATADSIVEHLEKTVRPRAKTDIDRRALDLLELLVERRAAELLNQPGPHSQKALTAMRRAFKRKWSQG